MKPTWAIQKNLVTVENYMALTSAFERQGIHYESFRSDPDKQQLPDIPTDVPTIFYGTTFVMNQVQSIGKWNPGVYFNETNFQFSEYFKHYGSLLLNFDCDFMKFGEFRNQKMDPNDCFFIRPNKDLKEFAGCYIRFQAALDWKHDEEKDNLTDDTDIVVSKLKPIDNEWRIIMVEGKAIAASLYKKDGKFKIDEPVPKAVTDLAEEIDEIWSPQDIYTLDIVESYGRLCIMECNCFNCSGLYGCNVNSVVESVSKYAEEHYS